MTDIRVGDIVKITRGEEGKPGYSVEIATVIKGYPCKKDEIPISEVERRLEDSRVTILERATKYRTALIEAAGGLMPIIVRGDGMVDLPDPIGVMDSQGAAPGMFIETCPYVPLDLIEEAEAWLEVWEDRESRSPADILADIVEAVRTYRHKGAQ